VASSVPMITDLCENSKKIWSSNKKKKYGETGT
jgi:hypothetical protein